MHPNPAFRQVDADRNLAFARQRGFGLLAVNGDAGPLLSHVPFLLDAEGATAELHLVRSNPIVRGLAAPTDAVIAVSGPDAYISPDWYDLPDQVPTWNYVAVHLRGTLRRLPDDRMHGLLDRVSDHFEERLAPKPVWKTAKMSDDAMQGKMRQIVPFVFEVSSVQGTWKLGQNKPEAARLAAARHLAAADPDAGALAGLMRDPPA